MGDRVHVSVDPARGIRAVKQAQALHASFAPAYDGKIVKVEGDGHVTVQKIGAQSRQPPERIHLGGDPGLQVGQQVHVSGEPGHRQVTSREQAHVQAPKLQSRL
jgi:hypothetical protein